tara:strand:- start:1079 stop:2002 length:924 start_codon:yes stop_codon:yes gene_type:complete
METISTISNNERYDISGVLRRRDQLMKALVSRYAGVTLEGATFGVFVTDVCEELPIACRTEAVAQSLFEYVGSSPTSKDLFHTFWRLSANVKSLCAGDVVHPWNEQRNKEWVPVQVLDAQIHRALKTLVYGVTVQVLSGSACPLRMHQDWSTKKVFYLAQHRDDQGHGFMFSRRRGVRQEPKYPFENAKQLCGLRFLALLEPALSEDGPDFREIRFTSSISSYNRELIKRRARLEEPFACPKNFPNTVKCYNCYFGRDNCPMACHTKTYVLETCVSCEKEAYFDPQDVISMYCVNCTAKRRMKTRTR